MSSVKEFKTTTGKTYKVALSKFSKKAKCSNLHLRVREILDKLLPMTFYCEEFLVKDKTILEFDFYIHSHQLAIEVQGQQHYQFSSLFHKTKQDFINQQKRDQLKRDWCALNDIELIELKYDAKDWEEKITESTRIHR